MSEPEANSLAAVEAIEIDLDLPHGLLFLDVHGRVLFEAEGAVGLAPEEEI